MPGEELRIEFTVTNETPEPAFGVTLALGVSDSSRFVLVQSARGTCEASTCDLGSFDDHESVSGHVLVLTKHGFDPEVRMSADLSWLLRNSNRRHAYTRANVLLADSNQPGGLVWSTSTDASSMSCGDFVEVDSETVYASFRRHLYAVSRSSGEVLWVKDGSNSMLKPTLADGKIYFYTTEPETMRDYVGSLKSSDGTLNWQHLVNGKVRGPATIYDGNVYFTVNRWSAGSSRPIYSYLMSMDASTGILNWQYRVDQRITTLAVEFGGNIYFGTSGYGADYFYSIDPRSGRLIRRFPTEGGSYSAALIADGIAYIGSRQGTLYSMDLATGKKNWEYQPEGRRIGAPVLSDGNVYFAIYNGNSNDAVSVYSLDAATGNLKWQYRPGNALKHPTVANGASMSRPMANWFH